MPNQNKIKQHYFLDITNEIKNICSPLIEHLGIKHFAYCKHYHNGTSLILTFKPEIVEKFNEIFVAGVSDEGSYVKDGFYLQCDMVNNNPDLHTFFDKFSDKFNSSHHLLFYEHYDDYLEQFIFGVAPNNSAIYSFYDDNIDLFEQFMLYFKDKARKIIDEAEKHRIIIPKTPMPEFAANHYEKIRENFLQDIKHTHYLLDKKNGNVFISQRELEVIYCLSRGRTAKEIGSELSLSPRTIETYLNNAKNKLGCFNKSQVIDLFLASKLNKKSGVFKK